MSHIALFRSSFAPTGVPSMQAAVAANDAQGVRSRRQRGLSQQQELVGVALFIADAPQAATVYVDGQRTLVEAMRYLAQADPVSNRPAIELLSEHVRTRFRMSDSPLG